MSGRYPKRSRQAPLRLVMSMEDEVERYDYERKVVKDHLPDERLSSSVGNSVFITEKSTFFGEEEFVPERDEDESDEDESDEVQAAAAL